MAIAASTAISVTKRRPILPWVVLASIVLAAILAQWLAPFDPLRQLKDGLDGNGMPLPPSASHWFGTDDLGRDVLSRLLFGARVSLAVGVSATLLAGVIAVAVGVAAGFFGGWIDVALLRVTEVVMAFPILLLAIALAAVLPPNPVMVVLTLGLVGWTALARLIRGQTLYLKEQEYIQTAQAVGAGSLWTIFHHVLPNLSGLLAQLLTLKLGDMLLLEAALSFLGIGIRPPTPSWGNMIFSAKDYFRVAPWLVAGPGLLIFLVVLCCNLIGERWE